MKTQRAELWVTALESKRDLPESWTCGTIKPTYWTGMRKCQLKTQFVRIKSVRILFGTSWLSEAHKINILVCYTCKAFIKTGRPFMYAH